jgi:hypothetical protein
MGIASLHPSYALFENDRNERRDQSRVLLETSRSFATKMRTAIGEKWWVGLDSNQQRSPQRDQIYSLTQHRHRCRLPKGARKSVSNTDGWSDRQKRSPHSKYGDDGQPRARPGSNVAMRGYGWPYAWRRDTRATIKSQALSSATCPALPVLPTALRAAQPCKTRCAKNLICHCPSAHTSTQFLIFRNYP